MELSCLIIQGQIPGMSGTKYPTVLCVSAGKAFPKNQDAFIYPPSAHVRVKKRVRLPDGRYMVQLKGVSRKSLIKGSVIVSGDHLPYRTRTGYGISRRPIPPGEYALSGGMFREHRLHGTVRVSQMRSGYRVQSEEYIPLVPGGRYRLLPPDELAGTAVAKKRARALPHELILCVPLDVERTFHRPLAESLMFLSNGPSAVAIHAVILRIAGWVMIPAGIREKGVRETAVHLSVDGLPYDAEGVTLVQSRNRTRFLLDARLLSQLERLLRKLSRSDAGTTDEKVARAAGLDPEVIDAVAENLLRSGELVRESGAIFSAGVLVGLSPLEKGLLEELREKARARGSGRPDTNVEITAMRKLVRRNAVIPVGEGYCPTDTYEELAAKLLHGKSPGGIVTVSEARETLGFAREQTVQFLESLDQRGVLRRDGSAHRVVKGLGSQG